MNTRDLIEHYLLTNAEFMLKNSYKDCHVKGLHSIALSGGNDRMIRMFLHESEGALYYRGDMASNEMPLAIHPHRNALTLIAIKGSFINHTFEVSDKGVPYTKWLFDSKINGGDGGFIERGRTILASTGERVYMAGNPNQYKVHMKAGQLHTVSTKDRFDSAVWMVLEGERDGDYVPYSYSNRDLEHVTAEGLYTPFKDIAEIVWMLKRFGILPYN